MRKGYFLAIFLLINTIDSNEAMNIGRIIHDGNSGIEGAGVGDEVGPKLGGEGVGVKVGVASEIGNMIGLLSWLYASMMYGVSPMPSLLSSVPL